MVVISLNISLSYINQYMSEKLNPLSPATRFASQRNLRIASLSPLARMSRKVSNETSWISFTTFKMHSLAFATTLFPIVMFEGNWLNTPGAGK